MPSTCRLLRVCAILLLFSLGLGACRPASAPAAPTLAPTSSPAAPGPAGRTPEVEQSPGTLSSATPQPAVSTAAAVGLAPAPAGSGPRANTLPPEDWRSWPVIPSVSARAVEIYRRGIALGSDPNAFSVVGDCQSIREVFLGDYDDPRLYHLDPHYADYQAAIDWFHGSFNRPGMAVRGGFTAASLLSPLHADPEYCRPGETPLTCEFRLHKPSIVIISLETWSNYKTIERYESYLRGIVSAVIEHGALPILLTKADVAEVGDGKHYINPAIARVAYDEDLPLANFWKVAQTLPNWGIDPNRDGFHLSEDGFRVKSFTALQALHTVWQAVSVEESEPAAAAAAVAAVEPVLQPTAVPAPGWEPISAPTRCAGQESACAVFGLVESVDDSPRDQGVFLFDLETQQIERFGPEGLRLQAVSPDRADLLVNAGPRLFILPRGGGTPEPVADDFLASSDQGAIWLPDGSGVVYIALREGHTALQVYTRATRDSQPIPGDDPVRLYPAFGPDRVYWQLSLSPAGCTARGLCPGGAVWVSALPGGPAPSAAVELSGVIQPAFAPDGSHFAFMDPRYNQQNGFNDKLAIEDLGERLPSRRLVIFPPAEGYMVRNRLLSYSWSPDGNNLFVILSDHSNYFEKVMVYHTYRFWAERGWLFEYTRLYGAQPAAAWSPDGKRVLLATTLQDKDGTYRIDLQVLDLETQKTQPLKNPGLSGPDYHYLENLVWLSGN